MDQEMLTPEAADKPRFDRAADRRGESGTLDDARSSAETTVLLVDRDRVPVDALGRVQLLPLDDAETSALGFLGLLDGHAVLVAPVTAADVPRATRWASVRDAVLVSDAAHTDIAIAGAALARWILDAPFCPACGGSTRLTMSGWARTCLECEREHFPRTDPAVIVAVTSGDRLLLGSNAMWENNRFSCFAGFVEAGESLEAAVHREVVEEAGVAVESVRYVGSQAWPFPRSLMLGFRAEAVTASAARPDGEEILEVRWFTRAEVRASLAGTGDFRLPGAASIAHALISGWLEESE